MSTGNIWGRKFRIVTYGESHGPALGVVIDGCPSGVKFDEELLHYFLKRRRPGGALASPRNETDSPEVLSGVFEGRTLGTPISILIRNEDARPEDYKNVHRPGHADDLWASKFNHSDPRGGGRASGRETVARVAAGAVAQMVLKEISPSILVLGYSSQIGPLKLSKMEKEEIMANFSTPFVDEFPARFPSPSKKQDVIDLLSHAKQIGESWGGSADIVIKGLPAGLGQPVFHKLKSDFAAALMGVGATCAFEVGHSLENLEKEGSKFHTETKGKSSYGGQRGGLSTGEDLFLRVYFKPTSSVLATAKVGRHDPCIIPRAVPVLESMVTLAVLDHILLSVTDNINTLKEIFCD